MAELPRISVVTSCFNAEAHIEATLRSVLQQNYPGLEYIVIDGASSDGTLGIAQHHADGLAVLRSEPDAGQYHGIQKGMTLATGEVMAWLNADDIYLPWTLRLVGELFARFPQLQWVIGTPGFMDAAGACTRISANSGTVYPQEFVRNGWFRSALAGYLQQESMFWRRSLWDKVGGLDLALSYAADFDLWRRFAEHAELVSVSVPLALFRQRPGEQRSSTGLDAYEAEVRSVCHRLKQPPGLWAAMAERSQALQHLCRMLIWKRGHVITYSIAQQRWAMTQARRPLGRTSMLEMLLERSTQTLASGVKPI
jgi:hypothetical protein